jgi:hypothetical protein
MMMSGLTGDADVSLNLNPFCLDKANTTWRALPHQHDIVNRGWFLGPVRRILLGLCQVLT